MAELTRIPGAAETPEGGVTPFAVDGIPVAVARSGGHLYAFRDMCTHAECPLSPGEVSDGEIECECHGARFDLATGAATALPATRPIDVYEVLEDGFDALVAVTS